MKYFKYSFLILILFSLSCKKDFLNIDDKSEIIRQEYVTDLQSTGEFLNGIYIKLSSEFYKGFHQIYPDLIADNIKPSSTGYSLIDPYNWSQKASTSGGSDANYMWLMGYQIIHSCSFVLEKADEYKAEGSAKADNMKAQAYALRALVHSVLVNIFAQPFNYTSDASHPGIPYVTTSDWAQPVTRNTVAEVYIQIINDLRASLPLFDQAPTNVLLMNRNAAKALLARVFLFKGDYLSAKNTAYEVATAVPIMTGSIYPSKLFTPEETEALFQLFPSSFSVNSTSYQTNFQGSYFSGPEWQVQFLATSDIASLITQDPLDVRNSWIKSGGIGQDTIVKYPVDVIPGFNPSSESYYPTLFRSSEMYLTAAESYAQLNIEDSARFYLDEIRKRANPSAAPTTATGQDLLDIIYTERRKELAFEGLRMFDLLRWKKGVNRQDATNSAAQNLPYPSSKAVAPIPVVDVKVTGLTQNPGY